jgi:hypothetical protein
MESGGGVMKRLFIASIVLLNFIACSSMPDTDVDHYQFDDISDDDFDGVINARDICHQTPFNVHVNNQGCTSWEVDENIKFIDLSFAFDSYEVPAADKQQLAELADLVNSNDDFTVTVIGDTSPEGSIQYNEKLAHNRAQAVVDVLVAYGVDDDKVDVHYFTEQLPIVNKFMLKRQHRVVALLHSPDYKFVPAWNIFTTENRLKNKANK